MSTEKTTPFKGTHQQSTPDLIIKSTGIIGVFQRDELELSFNTSNGEEYYKMAPGALLNLLRSSMEPANPSLLKIAPINNKSHSIAFKDDTPLDLTFNINGEEVEYTLTPKALAHSIEHSGEGNPIIYEIGSFQNAPETGL